MVRRQQPLIGQTHAHSILCLYSRTYATTSLTPRVALLTVWADFCPPKELGRSTTFERGHPEGIARRPSAPWCGLWRSCVARTGSIPKITSTAAGMAIGQRSRNAYAVTLVALRCCRAEGCGRRWRFRARLPVRFRISLRLQPGALSGEPGLSRGVLLPHERLQRQIDAHRLDHSLHVGVPPRGLPKRMTSVSRSSSCPASAANAAW